MEKEKYEIIVSKAFEDKVMDERLASTGVYVYNFPKELTYGERLLETIYKTKGKMIVFLEDDDLFLLHKLETIFDFYFKYPNLSYYHDSAFTIYESRYVNRDTLVKITEKTDLMNVSVHIIERKHKINFIRIVNNGGVDLSSCQTIERSVLLKGKELLGKCSYPIDDVIFSIAYTYGDLLIFDEHINTLYRVHGANDSLGTKGYIIDKNERANQLSIAARYLRGLNCLLINTDVKKTKLIHILKSRIFYFEFFSLINNEKTERRQIIRAMIKLVSPPNPTALLLAYGSFLASFIYLLSPALSRKFYGYF